MAERSPTRYEGISHRVNKRGKITYWSLWRNQDDKRRYQKCDSLVEALNFRAQKQWERHIHLQTPRKVRVAQRLGAILSPSQPQGYMNAAPSLDTDYDPHYDDPIESQW